MFSTLDMTAGGLSAQRARMDVIAGNVLNINTTRSGEAADGSAIPYRRRIAMFASGDGAGEKGAGVHVASVVEDPSAFSERYEPGHVDADPVTGIVKYPNVDLSTEYVNMLDASRAYEANITLMQTTKAMFNASLRLLA